MAAGSRLRHYIASRNMSSTSTLTTPPPKSSVMVTTHCKVEYVGYTAAELKGLPLTCCACGCLKTKLGDGAGEGRPWSLWKQLATTVNSFYNFFGGNGKNGSGNGNRSGNNGDGNGKGNGN